MPFFLAALPWIIGAAGVGVAAGSMVDDAVETVTGEKPTFEPYRPFEPTPSRNGAPLLGSVSVLTIAAVGAGIYIAKRKGLI